ncbi:hypothetical protein GCM10009839_12520 [Catenulispora yoronensis]|uniref:Uncharacterized protein n=1 Tax=Catenulispora yoronensis TaxID=450799 RepID=A0ABP5FA56_9ACTN
MDELDDLLRGTFAARDRETVGVAATGAVGLADAARRGHTRRTAKRRQLMAVGTVGVLAAGGSTALAFGRHGPSKPVPAVAVQTLNPDSTHPSSAAAGGAPGSPSPAGATSSPGSLGSLGSLGSTAPPQGVSTASPLPVTGSRAWSSHGLQVRVPEKWKANQEHCGEASEDTVLIGGGPSEACLLANPPVVNVVSFGSASNLDRSALSALPALHPATVGGKAAQSAAGRLKDGRTVVVIVVPDLDISVTVKGKDAKLVEQIAATAQLVDADANGCASRVGTVLPVGPPTRPGATTTMVPGTPIKAVVCHYGDGFLGEQKPTDGPTLLTNGSPIAANQIGGLTALLNALKPGLGKWSGLPGSCPPASHDGYVFRFSYASGPPVDVYLHTDDCDQLGFSNGAVTGLIPKAFTDHMQDYMPDMAVVVDANVGP